MKQKSVPIVFFNASVILAGLHSPIGGSAKLLTLLKQKQIVGVISEIICDETLRHTTSTHVFRLFPMILSAPTRDAVEKHSKMVIDPGDAHVLASAHESKADYLVTLDKKHLLVLQKTIKWVKIVSPKELLHFISLPSWK